MQQDFMSVPSKQIDDFCEEPSKDGSRKNGFFAEIWKHRFLYLLCLPGIIFLLCFSYIPMFGIVIAFKDYSIGQNILTAPWVEGVFDNFKFFFTSGHAWRVTKNTLILNALFIGIGTISEVFLAVSLNEINKKIFKKSAQSIMLLPYFMSWIIVSVIMKGFFASETGTINHLLTAIGLEKVNWYGTAKLWPPLLVFFRVWKGAGWGTIIYLATITGMNPQVYEAATIDGATRFQKIKFITIPLLIPTVIMLTILAVGKIFYGDVGMIYGLVGDNSILLKTTDVIDTYVLRALRSLGDLGMAAAIGLWQSVMGLIFVLATNSLAKAYEKDSALF